MKETKGNLTPEYRSTKRRKKPCNLTFVLYSSRPIADISNRHIDIVIAISITLPCTVGLQPAGRLSLSIEVKDSCHLGKLTLYLNCDKCHCQRDGGKFHTGISIPSALCHSIYQPTAVERLYFHQCE